MIEQCISFYLSMSSLSWSDKVCLLPFVSLKEGLVYFWGMVTSGFSPILSSSSTTSFS
jgi:hypothetical protein